jgi:hypothetical protein
VGTARSSPMAGSAAGRGAFASATSPPRSTEWRPDRVRPGTATPSRSTSTTTALDLDGRRCRARPGGREGWEAARAARHQRRGLGKYAKLVQGAETGRDHELVTNSDRVSAFPVTRFRVRGVVGGPGARQPLRSTPRKIVATTTKPVAGAAVRTRTGAAARRRATAGDPHDHARPPRERSQPDAGPISHATTSAIRNGAADVQSRQ